MSATRSTQAEDPFIKAIFVSAAGHVIIVIFVFVKALVFPSEPIDIRSAIRVDVVDLPDKLPTKLKAPAAPKAPPKVQTKIPPKVETKKNIPKKNTKKTSLKKAKNSQQKALERLKAMEALEKIKAEEEEKKIEEQVKQEFKGNKVTEGSSLSGLDRIAHERYLTDVKSHVLNHWNLPAWLANANLKGAIEVKIDERGFVIDKNLVLSSGNDVFDNLVQDTVDQASPFPAPPPRLKNVLAFKGFVLRFPE